MSFIQRNLFWMGCFAALQVSFLSKPLQAYRDFFPTVDSVKLEAQFSILAHLEQRILRTIESCAALESSRGGLINLHREVLTRGFVAKNGEDKEIRPYFVAFQGLLEQNLAYELRTQKLKKLIGIIHTPLPATPVCTKGEITKQLVDSSLIEDDRRLLTVQARADTVRDFLDSGGIIYIVYPKGGFEKRTIEQQKTYLETLKAYPMHLIDSELPADQLDPDMIGASYLYNDYEGNTYFFSIQASQACAPSDKTTWKIWHGSVKEPHIAERVSSIRSFLKSNNGPRFEI